MGDPAHRTGAEKAVFLHVGAPMVASDFLQRALWWNRHRLEEQGIRYPLRNPREHFEAAMDLRGTSWAGHRHDGWDGAWARIAGRIREWDGPAAVLSQELLGGVTEVQAKQAVESLHPAKVHVVFTARDLATQLAVDWQEHLKHAHTISFDEFTDDLVERGIDAAEPFGPMFWGLHDPVRVLATWRAAVPVERIHIITAPPGVYPPMAEPRPSGQPESGQSERGLPGEDLASRIWAGFVAVTRIDAARCDLAGIAEPAPLGAAEAELLRILNERIGPALGADYESIAREYLANELLAERGGRIPIVLPMRHHAWVAERSQELVESVRAAGYNVVGDLAELLPAVTRVADRQAAERRGATPQVDLEEVADAAVEVIEKLLWDLARVRERAHVARINHELAEVRGRLDRLVELSAERRSPVRRVAGRLVRRLRRG